MAAINVSFEINYDGINNDDWPDDANHYDKVNHYDEDDTQQAINHHGILFGRRDNDAPAFGG